MNADSPTQRRPGGNVTGEKPAPENATAGRVERDPVLDACRSIGRRLGIMFRMPATQGTSFDDRVRRIAFASGVPHRRVHLKQGWWRRDGGPLLARMAGDDGRVVALLPSSPTSYEIEDPSSGRRQRVDREAARGLVPLAYAFSRPFPSRPLSGWDVVRFEVAGWRRDALMVLAMGILGALIGFVVPVASGILFDRIVPDAERGRLVQLTILLFACAVVACTFRLTKAVALVRIEGKASAAAQAAMMDRVLALPAPFFRGFSVGDLTDRTMALSTVRQMVSVVTLQSLLAGIFSCFYLILLLAYDWKLTFVATGLVLVVAASGVAVSRVMVRFQREVADREGKLSGLVYQILVGVSLLRTTASENRALSVWEGLFQDKKGIARKAGEVGTVVGAFQSAYPVFAGMVIFWWVAVPGAQNFTTGKFFAFVAAYASLQNALLQMVGAFAAFFTAIPVLERAKPILETRPEVVVAPEAEGAGAGTRDAGRLRGRVEVERIRFRYAAGAPLVLDDVTLTFKPGEFVGLVGVSGAGKSTLIRLLLGFERPESGRILYDGQPLDELDLRAVRSQLGVVLQNGLVLRGSLFRNIVGASDLTMKDAWRAAGMAGLARDIERMPMGMHTVIGPAGEGLSGGQKQKLMIAAAIVHGPRILLWDEASSFLDEESERTVSDSVRGLGITRIVVAQRPVTVMGADRILVMDRGRIVRTIAGKQSDRSSERDDL